MGGMKTNTSLLIAALPLCLFGAKTPAGVEIPDVPQTEFELTLEPGEGWWGGTTVFGHQAPLGLVKPVFSCDIRRHSYANQAAPLMISTHGRYVWCDQGFACDIKDGKIVFHSDGVPFKSGKSGDSLKSAFAFASKSFFPPSGKTPDLLFVAAPQYNTWIELGMHQSQAKVLEYARKIVENGFPTGVLMIDDTWQIDYGTWEFNPITFPDPKAMMDELHKLGFKVILWTCPFVSMDSAEYRLLDGKGGLIRDGIKRPAAMRWWNGASAVLNFDKESDRTWYRAQLDRLQKDYGVDGFKFDAGDTGYYDVADQRQPPLTREAEGDLCRHNENWAKLGAEYPFNEYRACWKMGGQPLVQRLCDKGCDFTAIGQLIPDMIGAGLLGHPFVCPDMIGGGALDNFWGGEFNREAFIRSAQVHALAPMMQFSAAPWRVLSADDFAIVKKAVATRQKFAPRYVELAKECAKTGEPMLRSMDYQFPGCGYELITDQFVMGDFLIVAPQVKEGAAEREVVLPAGDWRGDDGVVVKGPAKVTVKTPLERLPYFEAVR